MLSQATETQSLQINNWPIDKLVFYASNPRKNDAAIDRMCGSIREFGFKIPVLARSDGDVVDGHLRLAPPAMKHSVGRQIATDIAGYRGPVGSARDTLEAVRWTFTSSTWRLHSHVDCFSLPGIPTTRSKPSC